MPEATALNSAKSPPTSTFHMSIVNPKSEEKKVENNNATNLKSDLRESIRISNFWQGQGAITDEATNGFRPWTAWTPCIEYGSKRFNVQFRFCQDGSLNCDGEKVRAKECP